MRPCLRYLPVALGINKRKRERTGDRFARGPKGLEKACWIARPCLVRFKLPNPAGLVELL